jgi:hypothetical protein
LKSKLFLPFPRLEWLPARLHKYKKILQVEFLEAFLDEFYQTLFSQTLDFAARAVSSYQSNLFLIVLLLVYGGIHCIYLRFVFEFSLVALRKSIKITFILNVGVIQSFSAENGSVVR